MFPIDELKVDNSCILQIYYSALNFKDIMIASGKISNDAVNGYERTQTCDLGMEYSGIDQEYV